MVAAPTTFEVPHAQGQLVWSPADPSLGVGVVTEIDGPRVWVRFLRLQETRAYTTRGGEASIARYPIAGGERVRDGAGQEHRVTKRLDTPGEALAVYELEDGQQLPEKDLIPEIREVGPRERLATLNLVHPEVVRARLQGLRLLQIGTRPGHAAILGSRVEWLPHQIDVAARAIAHDPVRMLLADEVGLGKTVEAALIYAGLRQEGRARRVLVLTPDQLAIQWLGELFRKVHELFVLFDEQRLDDARRDFPGLSPFEAHQRIVASIDRVAGDGELARAASAAKWDLVIVDEAHHLRWRPQGGGNRAYQLVEALAPKTRHLLLLTATPMALDPVEYHALLRLLDRTRFDDPAAFEATAQRVAIIREVARCVQTAVAEKRPLGKSVEKAALEVMGDDDEDCAKLRKLLRSRPQAARDALAREVMEALQYRHGLADYVVRNRRGPVGGLPERRPKTFALSPTPMQAALIEVGEEVMLELAGTLADPQQRRRTLGELLRALWATPRALAEVLAPLSPDLVRELKPHVAKVTDAPLDRDRLPTGDARLRWLVESVLSLARDEKILVFVESGVAVRALREALETTVGQNIATFHRGLSPRDQDRQAAWFRDPAGPQVMLSTEAGGEGRNFQFCHHVVLYDLPWRPATIEQRIGRIDRVGQRHDVHVWVPYFTSGYEAAILKVMQDAVGVLTRTVGGIDPVLEYVSDQVAELILDQADSDAWKALYREVAGVVEQARERIEAGIDPILDHASFSASRADELLAPVPPDLEEWIELFVERYAEYGKLDIQPKTPPLFSVEGAPSAAGEHREGGFVGTFSRTHALDHEDAEFLSFGHPLLEQALEWARTAVDASASLAICRGAPQDGAVFIWSFGLDLPDDVPEATTYIDHQIHTFALDESGARVREYDDLLIGERPLGKMDSAPLREAGARWRRVVEQSYRAAQALADQAVLEARTIAEARLTEVLDRRQRDLRRAQARELAVLKSRDPARKKVVDRHVQELLALRRERKRLETALAQATARLIASVAVRLMRAKEASA